MSIRRIKANTARVEGDYVLVEEYSRKSFGAILGFILGLVIVIILKTDLLSGMVVIFFAVFMMSLLFPGNVVREVPVADMVELKHYPDKERVTVVLDDERVKRKQTR